MVPVPAILGHTLFKDDLPASIVLPTHVLPHFPGATATGKAPTGRQSKGGEPHVARIERFLQCQDQLSGEESAGCVCSCQYFT